MKGMTKIAGLAVAVVFSGQVLALDPLGAPKASLGEGKTSVGLDYSDGDMTIERRMPGPAWSGVNDKLDHEVEMKKTGIKISRGLSDSTDISIRLGKADVEETQTNFWGASGNGDWKKDNDGDYWGISLASNIAEVGGVIIGVTASITEGEYDGDAVRANGSMGVGKIDMTEIQIALGASADVMDMVNVYGGLFLHRVEGDVYLRGNVGNGDNTQSLREQSDLGLYVGATITPVENLTIGLEIQDTGDADLAALSASWAF